MYKGNYGNIGYSRIYGGNAPSEVNTPKNMEGLFKRKTWLEKQGRDNPTGLLLMGVGLGIAASFAYSKFSPKKKKR